MGTLSIRLSRDVQVPGAASNAPAAGQAGDSVLFPLVLGSDWLRRLTAVLDVPEPHADIGSRGEIIRERAAVVLSIQPYRVDHESVAQPAQTQRLAVEGIEGHFLQVLQN